MRYFAAPAGGAGGFEALDYVAEALVHALLDMNDAMPMVGHAYLAKGFYGAAFGGLYGGGLLPFLMDDSAGRRMEDVWFGTAIIEAAEPWHSFRNDERDEIDAWLIVVMARIMGSV